MFPDFLTIKGKELPLIVKETRKAKRFTLRLRPEGTGTVSLTMPVFSSQKQALNFLTKSVPWLEKQASQLESPFIYKPGITLPIFGKPYVLNHFPSRSLRFWLAENHFHIYAPQETLGISVEKSLRQVAKQFFQQRTFIYANQLKKTVNRITLKNTRSRWGSCSVTGNISYSWRLIFAPENVADYVCAHEVAHLVEMNHSAEFWRIVEGLHPDYKKSRLWLRQNGKMLFQYTI